MTVSWTATLDLIRADMRRRLTLEGKPVTLFRAWVLAWQPGALCVAAYRVSTWLHGRNHRLVAKIITESQYIYTGIEIHIGSSIGPGLVLSDHRGTGIGSYAIIGKNCTILGPASMVLGGMEDVDLAHDRIVLGDHCVVGVGARVVRAVVLADGTQIKPNSVVVVSSLVPGSILTGIPARRRGVVAVERVIAWNPLKPHVARPFLDAPAPMPEAALT